MLFSVYFSKKITGGMPPDPLQKKQKYTKTHLTNQFPGYGPVSSSCFILLPGASNDTSEALSDHFVLEIADFDNIWTHGDVLSCIRSLDGSTFAVEMILQDDAQVNVCL